MHINVPASENYFVIGFSDGIIIKSIISDGGMQYVNVFYVSLFHCTCLFVCLNIWQHFCWGLVHICYSSMCVFCLQFSERTNSRRSISDHLYST